MDTPTKNAKTRWTKYVKARLESMLEKLIDCGVLKEWTYKDKNGAGVTDSDILPKLTLGKNQMTFEEWADLRVCFEMRTSPEEAGITVRKKNGRNGGIVTINKKRAATA